MNPGGGFLGSKIISFFVFELPVVLLALTGFSLVFAAVEVVVDILSSVADGPCLSTAWQPLKQIRMEIVLSIFLFTVTSLFTTS